MFMTTSPNGAGITISLGRLGRRGRVLFVTENGRFGGSGF